MVASLPRVPGRPLIEPPVSVKAVVLRGDAVLLGENDRGEWELLGGRPEPGESFVDALVREVQEEAGLTVTVRERVLDEPFEVVPGRVVRIVAHRCDLVGDPVPRPSHEHRGVGFVSPAALALHRLPDVYLRAIESSR